MAEQHEESKAESVLEKITEKIHGGHDSSSSSSSSDSDNEKSSHSPSSFKSKIYRLFGREKPVHKVLGGGKRTRSIISHIDFLFLNLVLFFFSYGCMYFLNF